MGAEQETVALGRAAQANDGTWLRYGGVFGAHVWSDPAHLESEARAWRDDGYTVTVYEVWAVPVADARLMAAAPDLAAALEALEWVGAEEGPDGSYATSCRACGWFRADGGHAPDCALHAALVAAGRRG